jgi:hypothetical protein
MSYIGPLHWKSITIYTVIHLGSGLRSTVTLPITLSSNGILEWNLISGRSSAAPLVLLQPTMHWSHSMPCSRGVTPTTLDTHCLHCMTLYVTGNLWTYQEISCLPRKYFM